MTRDASGVDQRLEIHLDIVRLGLPRKADNQCSPLPRKQQLAVVNARLPECGFANRTGHRVLRTCDRDPWNDQWHASNDLSEVPPSVINVNEAVFEEFVVTSPRGPYLTVRDAVRW